MSERNESQILRDIRSALGKEPDLVLWRLSQGGMVERSTSRWRAGLSVNGAADLIGILEVSQNALIRPIGRFFALEVKGPRGQLRPEQELFLRLVQRRGGFAAVVRSVDEARAALERARKGESG